MYQPVELSIPAHVAICIIMYQPIAQVGAILTCYSQLGLGPTTSKYITATGIVIVLAAPL